MLQTVLPPPLFDDTYTGPRWTYGVQLRPIAFANVADGWIIHSDRPHPDFAFGTVDYARELTGVECRSYQLTALGFSR